MAKSKKAAPKKAPTKKPIAKKTSPKKATAKKPSPPKITSKKAKPKATKPAAKAKTTTKTLSKAKASNTKPPKGKSPESLLEQNFLDSLAKLESFWSKKVTTLKKECDTLVGKHKKGTQGKPTPKQAEKLNSLEKEIALKQDALDEASFAAAKFSALSQKMNAFENEWLNQLNVQTSTNSAISQAPASHAQKMDFLPHGISKITDVENMNHDWEDEPESDAEEATDDLEDIFMPQDDLSEFEVIEDFSVTNDDFEDEE